MSSDSTMALELPHVSQLGRGRLNRRLSSQLARLAAGLSHRPVRLGELSDALQARGQSALMIVLAFPFITPVPLPGLSTVFGMALALLGLRLALGYGPGLPRCIAARELPARLLPRLLLPASRAFLRLERVLKPRAFYPEYPVAFLRTGGAVTCICGLLLLLPLPVPFSNALPALTILLLAAAGLARDGAVYIAGCVQFLLCLAFFAALGMGGSQAWQWLVN